MTTVETALGPVATAALGPTLMHEHIVTRSPGVHENWPHLFDRDGILALAERKMADLYCPGYPHGRRPDHRRSRPRHRPDRRGGTPVPVHVLVATGVWWMPPRYFNAHGIDAVADLFIRDITQGIGTSGVKAAIIKCATDTAGVTPVIENILRAAARAQQATGCRSRRTPGPRAAPARRSRRSSRRRASTCAASSSVTAATPRTSRICAG